jgi:hypothetical protein
MGGTRTDSERRRKERRRREAQLGILRGFSSCK